MGDTQVTRVYLAGAIELVHPSYATQWRADAKRIIRELTDWIPVDPMEYEDQEGPWNDEQIVQTDRYLMKNCDVVLLDGRQPSWGAGFEAAWASEASIPIVVWGRRRDDSTTFLRYHATSFHDTLSDAILNGVAPLGMPTL